MTDPLPAVQILQERLAYSRAPKDVALDLSAALLARILQRADPRGDVAREQMQRFGILDPEQSLRNLYRTSCRELFRILGRRFPRLDLSPIQGKQLHGPILYLSYHIGNWEWLGGIFHRMHGDFRPVTRGIRNKWIHAWAQQLRQSVGMHSLIDNAGLRGGRKALEDGAFLAFLADQTPPGASRPGICLGTNLPVSALPEWWARGKCFRWLTGVLLPISPVQYELRIEEFPAEDLPQWDRLLDRHLTPLLQSQPHQYFGWWHHRLVSRTRK